jgi:hypothetical protein
MNPEFYTVKLTLKHLKLIRDAVEMYSRLRSGQIDTALDIVYLDKFLCPEEKQLISSVVIDTVFPSKRKFENISEFDKNSYPINLAIKRPALEGTQFFSVSSKEIGRGGMAYEIQKTLDQFLAVHFNNGFFNPVFRQFDDPCKVSDEPLPEIVGFKKTKEFYIEDPEINLEIHKNFLNKLPEKVWKIVDEYFQGSLPQGESSQICYDNSSSKYYVEVRKPIDSKLK